MKMIGAANNANKNIEQKTENNKGLSKSLILAVTLSFSVFCLIFVICRFPCIAHLTHRISGGLEAYRSSPAAVMGTRTELTVVVDSGDEKTAKIALSEAEAALRRIEAMMSVHLHDSQLAVFNAAPAGQYELPDEIVKLLIVAKEFHGRTGGAFDITARPLFELWKQAGKNKQLPTDEQIKAARDASNWELVVLPASGNIVTKRSGSACVDLGGIAKGYAVDRAIEAMRRAGAKGALACVGGEIRCFGQKPDGQAWIVGVENPFLPDKEEFIATLKLNDMAVSTSGNYRRFVEIGGKRFSHIVDPRGGRPAEASPSVTVIAPNATTSDAWATALDVLGPEGLKLLPPQSGIEAMIVTGGPENYKILTSDGFSKYAVN